MPQSINGKAKTSKMVTFISQGLIKFLRSMTAIVTLTNIAPSLSISANSNKQLFLKNWNISFGYINSQQQKLSSIWKCWLLLWTSLSAEYIRIENWNALSEPSINIFLHLRLPRAIMLWSLNFFTFCVGRNFPKVRYWATPTARWQI